MPSSTSAMAAVTHEIRTPVHTILGMSELLAGTTLTPAQQQYVDALRGAASTLVHQLDTIFDPNHRAGPHAAVVRAERFWLPDLLERVVAAVAPRAAIASMSLRVTAAPELPRALVGDPMRLQQVLMNLLLNAFKYAPRLSTLSASGSAGNVDLAIDGGVDDGRVALCFTVSDNGPGIPVARRAAIFEPWERLAEHASIDGLGLGLAVSRRLIVAMGGTLTLDGDDDDDGAVFRIHLTLPVARSPAPPPRRDGAAQTTVAVRGLRFLVIGSDALGQAAVDVLAAWAPRIDLAGDEALGERLFHLAAAGDPYHVVLIDSELPHGGAVASGAALRGHAAVLIALPPAALADLGNLVEEIQAVPLLTPLSTAGLYAALERALLGPVPSTVDDPPDLSGQVLHVADDDADARTLIRAFLQGSGLDVRLHESAAALLKDVAAEPARVSLVICDVEMPGGGAPLVLAELAAERADGLPITALTAHGDAAKLDELRQLGFAGILQKPFSRAGLLAFVRRAVRPPTVMTTASPEAIQLEARMALARRDYRALESLAARLPALVGKRLDAAAKKKNDAEVRTVLREMDTPPPVAVDVTPMSREVAEAVRQVLPDYLVRRVQDANDLGRLVAEGRFDQVAFIGHRMAGTGTAFGLPQLSDVGHKLELAGRRRDGEEIATLLRRLNDVLTAAAPSVTP